MIAVPIEFKDACAFVTEHHRHHAAPQGHKYSIAAAVGEKVVGVVIVGRPVSRMMQDGWTLEVTRLATDGTRNACSFLYAAAWRAARAMGYKKLTTCILDTEPGVTLKAAGWRLVGMCGGGSWSRVERPRIDNHPTQTKLRFEITDNNVIEPITHC